MGEVPQADRAAKHCLGLRLHSVAHLADLSAGAMVYVAIARAAGAADDHAVGVLSERADLAFIEAELYGNRLRGNPFRGRCPAQEVDERIHIA